MLHSLLLVIALLDPSTWQQDVDTANPVFNQLVSVGLPLTDNTTVKLPSPTMPDGLDATEQQKILSDIGGRKYSIDELTRQSIVAPQLFSLSQQEVGDATESKIRIADLYFVGRAKLDSLANPEFINNMIESSDQQGESQILSAEKLNEFGITIADADQDRESFGLVRFTLFDKVKLQMTGHTFWSKSEDSIIYAMMVDQTFNANPELASTWQVLRRQDDGQLALAESGKFAGAGMYLKVTQLKSPKDSVFVELHLAFIEPKAWFGGANLIGSKLPPLAQSQVRDIRRKAEKASSSIEKK